MLTQTADLTGYITEWVLLNLLVALGADFQGSNLHRQTTQQQGCYAPN
jgi:hypothetical protein